MATDHPPSPGHFYATAVGLRKAYEMMSEWVDDLKRMDDIERKSAEMTTYSVALAIAAREHGLGPEGLIAMVVSCINDIRRQDGKSEIVLSTVKVGKS